MTSGWAEVLALVLLAAVLASAVVRPFGIGEAVVAVPAAVVVVVAGAEPLTDAARSLRGLGWTVAFLVTILVFGHLCAERGVFDYLGASAGRAARGRPVRLLAIVVSMAALVTAVLTLDATVVLLTPVVLATTRRLRVASRPQTFACLHLANSGSLLLPVSNLTNLLAYAASGLSFARFTAYMAAPWILVCLLEFVALRIAFRADLSARPIPSDAAGPDLPVAPRYALTVLAATVVGFVAATAIGISPAVAAFAGVIALAAPEIWQRRTTVFAVARAANLGFAGFVFALGILVDTVTRHGLGRALRNVTPHDDGLVAMLAVALLAALLANLVNNLPATLALIPALTGHPALVLAMLIGVNIGPNLTYPGSLANLLWNRLLPDDDRPSRTSFHVLGIATVPVLLVAATLTLWGAVRFAG